MAKEAASKMLSVEGREVEITHPDKLYFSSQARITKLDLVLYYLSVAPGALAGIQDRPIVLKRFVNGAEAEAFYQKRAPAQRPPGCEQSLCLFLRAELRTRSSSMTHPGSPGSSIWVASNFTRTRCAPIILSNPTNCGSTSIRFRVLVGQMCAASLSKCRRS